jgi:hypothetical protein
VTPVEEAWVLVGCAWLVAPPEEELGPGPEVEVEVGSALVAVLLEGGREDDDRPVLEEEEASRVHTLGCPVQVQPGST